MIITAKIKTRQKAFAIVTGNVWTISVKAPAEKGKANLEIIKELSKRYGKVRIVSGHKSNKKRIKISDKV